MSGVRVSVALLVKRWLLSGRITDAQAGVLLQLTCSGSSRRLRGGVFVAAFLGDHTRDSIVTRLNRRPSECGRARWRWPPGQVAGGGRPRRTRRAGFARLGRFALREEIGVQLGQPVYAAEEFEEADVRVLRLARFVGVSRAAAERQRGDYSKPVAISAATLDIGVQLGCRPFIE